MPILNRPSGGDIQPTAFVEYKGLVGTPLVKNQICYLSYASNKNTSLKSGLSTTDFGYGYTFTKQIDNDRTVLLDITSDGGVPYLRGRIITLKKYCYETDEPFIVSPTVKLVEIPNFDSLVASNFSFRTKFLYINTVSIDANTYSSVMLFMINTGANNSSVIHMLQINSTDNTLSFVKTFDDTYKWNTESVQVCWENYKRCIITTTLNAETCTVNVYGFENQTITPYSVTPGKTNTFNISTIFFMDSSNKHLTSLENYYGNVYRTGYYLAFFTCSTTKDETRLLFYALNVEINYSSLQCSVYKTRLVNDTIKVDGDATVEYQFNDTMETKTDSITKYYSITCSDTGFGGYCNTFIYVKVYSLKTGFNSNSVDDIYVTEINTTQIDNKMNPASYKRYLRGVVVPIGSNSETMVSRFVLYGNGNEPTPLQFLYNANNTSAAFDRNIQLGAITSLNTGKYNEFIVHLNSAIVFYSNDIKNDLNYPKIVCYSYVLPYKITPITYATVEALKGLPNIYLSKETYTDYLTLGTVYFPEYPKP